MKSNTMNGRARSGRPLLPALLAAALSALAVACGGGGVGTGGTGLQASGPVTGFGSVIVGGITFDDERAERLDDDGAVLPADQPLRLGMTLQLQAGQAEGAADLRRAPATRLQLRSAVVGPVTAVDGGAGRLTVLGQTISVSAATAIDPGLRGGLAGLRAGDELRVHGLADADGVLATRIEPAPAGSAWRLRGPVAAFDAAARRLRIGALWLDLSPLAALPPGLAAGQVVQATLDRASGAAAPAVRRLLAEDAAGEAQPLLLEGLLTPMAGGWAIDGQALDLTQARIEPQGARPAAGLVAVAEGVQRGTRLATSRLELLDRAGLEARPFRLRGPVQAFDTTARRGEVRGVVVDFSSASFPGGDPARLAEGVLLRVQGPLAEGGTVLRAQRVFFD
jgi:hypothetical protein